MERTEAPRAECEHFIDFLARRVKDVLLGILVNLNHFEHRFNSDEMKLQPLLWNLK